MLNSDTQHLKYLIQNKKWDQLNRMLLGMKKAGIDKYVLARVMSKIIHEAMKH